MERKTPVTGTIGIRKRAKPTDPFASEYPVRPDSFGTRDPGGAKAIQFRHSDPRVAEHIARMIFKHNFNYEAAVAAMSPKKMSEEQIASAAFTLRKSPWVKEKLTDLYKAHGLDDKSFSKYVSVLWEWFLDGDGRKSVAAAKILASGFGVGDKADESKKPQELKIKGLTEGLAHMGVIPDSANLNPTGFGKIEEEIEQND